MLQNSNDDCNEGTNRADWNLKNSRGMALVN